MTDQTVGPLTSRWTALPNDEIGGWAVSTDGRSPAAGGVMAADLVRSQQVAEHIADLHNLHLTQTAPIQPAEPDTTWAGEGFDSPDPAIVHLGPAAATIRGKRYEVTPLTIRPDDHEAFMERYRRRYASLHFDGPRQWPGLPTIPTYVQPEGVQCPSTQPWICTRNDCPGCFNAHCWTTNPTACSNGCDVAPRGAERNPTTTPTEENAMTDTMLNLDQPLPGMPEPQRPAPLWALHITGSDDVIAMPSREVADGHKEVCDATDRRTAGTPNLVALAAKVVPWGGSREDHAAALAEDY